MSICNWKWAKDKWRVNSWEDSLLIDQCCKWKERTEAFLRWGTEIYLRMFIPALAILSSVSHLQSNVSLSHCFFTFHMSMHWQERSIIGENNQQSSLWSHNRRRRAIFNPTRDLENDTPSLETQFREHHCVITIQTLTTSRWIILARSLLNTQSCETLVHTQSMNWNWSIH